MCDDWSLMEFAEFGEQIQEVSCVYFLFDGTELVYIGQTNNLRRRVMCHNLIFNDCIKVGNKKITHDLFDCVYYIEIEDDKHKRLELEKKYILDYEPKLNYSGLFNCRMFPSGISYADIYDTYKSWGILK